MTNFERALGRMNLQKPGAAIGALNSATYSDETGKLAAFANRIGMVIAVFAFGVWLGMVIA